jgi:single-strand DNA-binding protein
MAVCSVRLVANSRKQVNGEWVDDKELWIDCSCFKNLAENVAESISKGDLVIVSGRLQTEKWESKEGEKRSAIKMIANSIAPSLAMATAKVTRASRSGSSDQQSTAADDPWATSSTNTSDDPPF